MSGMYNDITGQRIVTKGYSGATLDRFDMAFNTEKFRKKAIEQIVSVTSTEGQCRVYECELKGMETKDLWKVYEARVINKEVAVNERKGV